MSALLPHGRSTPPQEPDNSGDDPPRPPGPSEQRGSGSPRTHFPSSKLRPRRGRGRGGRPRRSRAVGLDAAGPGPGPGPGRGGTGRRAGAARGSGRGRGGTSYSSSEAMVGGGVAGGREGQGRGEAPPPPGGRHFVSVGSLLGLRFLLPLPAPGAQHGRASHTHCQCGPAAAAAGLCAGAAAQRALRAPRSLPGGPARARAHRAPPRGRAGLGRARRRCTAARLAPWLPLSGIVQKASYLRPKNLPRLLSMPSAAARARRSRAPALRVFGPPAREGRGGRRGGAGEGSSGLRSGPRRAGCRRERAGRKGRSQGAVGVAQARRGRGRGERWAGPRLVQVPSQGSDPAAAPSARPPRRGTGTQAERVWGPRRSRRWRWCTLGQALAGPKLGRRQWGRTVRVWNPPPRRPRPCRQMRGLPQSAEFPPPCTRHGHPSRARPTRRGRAAWPGGTPRPNTCPPPPRQPPRPGTRTTRPAVWPGALRARSLGGSQGVGARRSRGRREGAAASTLPAASPTQASLFLLERPPPRKGSCEEGPESGLWGGLGSNGTKLSMGGTAWSTKTTGPRGQNSDGLTLPTLHRRDGQSGDGPYGRLPGTPAGRLDVPPSVRNEEGVSWPDSPKRSATSNCPPELLHGTLHKRSFTFSPTSCTWKAPLAPTFPPKGSLLPLASPVLYLALVPNRPPTHQAPPTTLRLKIQFNWAPNTQFNKHRAFHRPR